MPAPEIVFNGGVYRTTWPDDGLVIRLDRLREDSRQNLTGECQVLLPIEGQPRLLLQRRITLTTGGGTAARALKERWSHVLWDWGERLETACVLALRRYREGEPVVSLDQVTLDPDAKRYSLAPVLLREQPTMFFGLGKSGKSYLALYMAALLQADHQDNGYEPVPCNVLYLDYEASAEQMTQRLNNIRNGLGIPFPPVAYRFCSQPLAAEVEDIQRLIADRNIGYIWVDSASAACGGDPSEVGPTMEFYRAIRAFRVGVGIIHHTPKGATEKTPYGCVQWTNQARNIYMVRGAQEPGAASLDMSFRHWACNDGMLQPTTAFRLTWAPDTVKVEKLAIQHVPSLAHDMPMADQMSRLMTAEGARTTAELAAAMGTSQASIRSVLSKHKGRRWAIVSTDDNEQRWGVLTSATP